VPRAEATIEIGRSPEDVFDFLAIGENNLLWRPGVLDVGRVSGQGMGAVWRQGVCGPGGRRIAADYEITEYERPTRLAFRAIAGPARPQGLYALEPAHGWTRLTFALWWQPRGLAKFLSGSVKRTMVDEVGQLVKLKAVLEKR
jgi:uncharacterized protein YndB with AHSA1/START domain